MNMATQPVDRSLKEKTARGLFWGFLSSGGMQLLNLVIGIFLARLLSPQEYGIVGMLTIFSFLAVNLQDSGFGVALVNIRDIRHDDYNSVFWFNVVVSVTLYAVLFLCAPLIAAFFRQPCLTALSRYVFVGFIFAALGNTPNAMLTRQLMVREKTIVTLLALALSGTVGVVMAFKGFSYWSLATQQLLYNAVVCGGRYWFARWRPTFHFDLAPVRRMFSFSYKVMLTMVLGTLSNNVLTVIFGRLFPPHDVGNYTQANKWNTMAGGLVSGTVAQVAQPVLVRVNDDRDRQRRVFGKMLRFTAFLSFPAMLGLALVAPQFIQVAIGSKWTSCIPLLQILCVSGAFLPLFTVYQHLLLSMGKSNIYMWLNVAQTVLVIASVLACHAWGITVMVAAFATVGILWLLAWQYYAMHLIGYSYWQMFKDLLPFLIVTVAVLGLTLLLTMRLTGTWTLLVVRVLMAALLYMGVMKVLKVKIFEECIGFVREKLKF